MNNKSIFPGRLGIQQRVVPSYRVEFFDLLAESCAGGLSIFAGDVRQDESIPTSGELMVAEYSASKNHHFQDIQSSYYFLWQNGIVKWLERWNPDGLIVEANPRYLSTFQGIRWMRSRGRPVIGWGLGSPEKSPRQKIGGSIFESIRNFLRGRMLEQLDGIIAYSHKGAEEYKELIDPDKPVFVATNAVAKRPVGPPPLRKSQFTENPILLYVGRLQARKKLDNLIRACSNLPDGMQPVIWIVGDGPEKKMLEDLSKEIYSKVEFKGRRTGTELSNLFVAADLFILPGTGGLAVQEAMSYALPVIVAEGDGTQNDLVFPDNGWLVTSNDEKSLEETLKIALSDPIRLRAMGESSFRIVQDDVNIEQMVKVFIEALDETSKAGRL
jgi:glycosyltransferase involved in cell wall biosynthesis